MEFITEANRIYAQDASGKLLAEITFPDIDGGKVNIDHTFVDESLRGQGTASGLVEAAAQEIQRQGKKATVTCSYAIKWFERHSEYEDILE